MGLLHRHRWATPYLLLLPGLAFLALFFLVPTYYLANTSLQSGDLFSGYVFSWAWDNYSHAVTTYKAQFIRSLAYWIAFRGGRWKNLLLLFIIAPFFVTYLIRTLAWETLLGDEGFIVHTLKDLHLLAADGRLLATSTAVVAGITYNFLPFMALPLYFC